MRHALPHKKLERTEKRGKRSECLKKRSVFRQFQLNMSFGNTTTSQNFITKKIKQTFLNILNLPINQPHLAATAITASAVIGCWNLLSL